MKTLNLNTQEKSFENNPFGNFTNDALSMNELFSVRGGNSDTDTSTSTSTETDDDKETNDQDTGKTEPLQEDNFN